MDLKNKDNIQDKHLFHRTNTQSKKAMVSACVTWKGDTKPFFVSDKGFKINSTTYKKHLEKDLLPKVNRNMNDYTWIFIEDSANRANIVQDFLNEKLGKSLLSTQNDLPHPHTVILLTTTSGTK